MNVVRPGHRPRAAPSLICCSVEASTAEVASSRTRIRGSASSARAIATRWRWPPLSVSPRSPTRVVVAVGQRSMKSWACARRAARSISSRACVGAAARVGDVVGDGGGEQERRVVDDRDRLAQRDGVDVAHVGAVDEHRAGVDVVEPREQRDERGLARARSRRRARRSCPPATSSDDVVQRVTGRALVAEGRRRAARRGRCRRAAAPASAGAAIAAARGRAARTGARPRRSRAGPGRATCRASASARAASAGRRRTR